MTADHADSEADTRPSTRRSFLKTTGSATAAALSSKLGRPVFAAPRDAATCTLLKHGLIVDGTGKKAFLGDVLIKGAKIDAVSTTPIDAQCPTIDCTDKVIAPGFIDAHSHMDWVLALEGQPELKSPFLAQGCTTFIAGNCGYSAGGFRKDSPHKKRFNPGIFPDFDLAWNTMAEYFDHARKIGMTHNLVNMVGHGTARLSMRWDDPSPLSDAEMTELLMLLEQAMDQGAHGVSLGLQYTPGIFATSDELKRIAQLVAKKDRLLTVHARAYSALSPDYEVKSFGMPHNVLAIKEMIDLAKATGVRVQFSHLIFAGTLTHRSYAQALEMIDKARADGVDIVFDTYPYHCGNTGITVVLPKWFREGLPANYTNPTALKRLELELTSMTALLGFGYEDIQITYAGNPDLNQYNGMFLSEIAKQRNMRPFDVAIDFAQHAEARGAWVLLHKYSNMEIIDALMKHPAALFMTDAVPVKWLRNPAAYGSFPLFLQYARDRKLISLEEAVRKMTGATAERMRIKDRGFVRKGLAADLAVFDYKTIKDNTTLKDFDRPPTGIESVFLNGKQVVKSGKVNESIKAGLVIPA
ncbi:MAG: amidohydrolase family protein [Phycisphaerae bacterium]|nr:amidohydrolase family protein [Phycisphaerae bacterium]